METPVLFSIIIPTYNRAAFILKTINTFLAQSYTNFEVIIVDDGSKDATDEIVKSITDKRIHYYKKTNEERGAARNYGLALSKGDYVNFFDSDDQAYPNHLVTAFKVIEKFKFPEMFHLGHDIKSPDGKLLSKHNNFDGNIEEYAIKSKKISINALFVKREIAEKIKFSENRLLSASEDALFLCQLCARYPLQYDNTITSTIIEHDTRSMIIATEQQLLNRQKLMIEGLEGDEIFMRQYGCLIPDIKRGYFYQLTLASLLNNNNEKALEYFQKYSKGKFPNPLKKRTLVFVKKYLHNIFFK